MLQLPTPAELKAARRKLGLTQAELGRAAGVSQPLIARIERGTVDPSYSTLRSLIEALNRSEGRQAAITDIMTPHVAAVKPTESLGRAVRVMRSRGYSQVPVVARGVPVGSLREDDIVRALSEDETRPIADRRVRDVMGPPFPAVAPDEALDAVRHLLESHPAVLVMQRGKVRGIITKTNLLETVR